VCVAHRTTDDTRHKTAADIGTRACTCVSFDRDAKRADLPAAGRQQTAAAAGSVVVGDGALRAVVLRSGLGCVEAGIFGFATPLPGISTRTIGIRHSGCMKYTSIWGVRRSARRRRIRHATQ